MSRPIALFPYLSKKMKVEAGIKVEETRVWYTDPAKNRCELILEQVVPTNPEVYIKDPAEKWNADEYNFVVTMKVKIHNPSRLYGSEGLAGKNGNLGIALLWSSPDSGLRGTSVKENKVIPNGPDPVTFTLSYVFPKGTFRELLSIRPVIYVVFSYRPSTVENYFANQSGMVVGSLDDDTVQIRFSGSGSIFPYYEISEKNGPLWKIRCDWADPQEDMFSEAVGIYVNTAHPRYKFLNPSHKSFDMELYAEIMAHAIFVVIEKLRIDPVAWELAASDEELKDGSVVDAIRYYREAFGQDWNWELPEEVDTQLRQYLLEGLNGNDSKDAD